MDQPTIYFLAGLGFDKRIFEKLILQNVIIKHLKWIEPEPNEDFDNYIKRIADQISSDNTRIILVGHSFGGIVVQKISKLIPTEKVIIISSIKSKQEMSIPLKLFKYFPLYKMFNQKVILRSFPFWARAFGYNSEKGRNLFIQMISSCSDNYFKWAMNKIVHFEGIDEVKNLYHIHGTNDKTFPIKRIKNPIPIKDGSHFMVYSKTEEVSEVLNKYFN